MDNVNIALTKSFQRKLQGRHVPPDTRQVIKALSLDLLDRKPEDTKVLINFFKKVKCFNDLKMSNEDVLKVINQSTVSYVKREKLLFRIGDRGETFFVCLSGKSVLFLPNKQRNVLKNRKRELEEEIEEGKKEVDYLKQQAINSATT